VYICASEDGVMKALALLGVLAMVGMAVMPMVVGNVVWYVTSSDVMGAAALGGTAAIIAAGIQTTELAGMALVGAVVGGVGAAIIVGL